MTGIGSVNLKVAIFDSDFFALQAINSYLAWDRRTRVKRLCESMAQLWDYIHTTPAAERPDIVVMQGDSFVSAQEFYNHLVKLHEAIPGVLVVCLAQVADPLYVEAAAEGGAKAFLLKQEVRLRIAWALVYIREQDFVVTPGVVRATQGMFNTRIFHAAVLPDQKDHPELTDRIRQAIKLCVVEGMPAHLAADEMGISLHTIRGYIKEGYRILEAYDENEYPVDMTPQERAFMRFTALEDDKKNAKKP